MTGDGDRVAIARLGRPHGVRGDITAHADGPTLGTLEPGDTVFVRIEGVDRTLVLESRRGDPLRAILGFEGVTCREEAAVLTGNSLLVDAELLPGIVDDDTFYVRDLLGFEVFEGDRLLGPVADVVPGPANDAMVITGPVGDVLVPFTYDAVVEIDHDGRRILLRADLLGSWAWGEDQ
jgi:16S rRNA processing protein RimM